MKSITGWFTFRDSSNEEWSDLLTGGETTTLWFFVSEPDQEEFLTNYLLAITTGAKSSKARPCSFSLSNPCNPWLETVPQYVIEGTAMGFWGGEWYLFLRMVEFLPAHIFLLSKTPTLF